MSNTSAVIGDDDVYTITAHDNGPLAATGVTVTDVLPNGVVFVSSSASQGAYDPPSGIWTIGALAVGGTATSHITVRLAATGVIRNTASKSGETQTDPNPANDSSSVTIVVASAPTPPVPATGASPASAIPAGLGQGIALFGVVLSALALVMRRRTLSITTSSRSAVAVAPAVSSSG